MITYFVTGSKLACDINASCSPAGSYTTVLNWIREASSSRIEVENETDVVTFFDNNQVMARNWRVNFDSKASVSVITNFLHLFPSSTSFLQNNVTLSPATWRFKYDREELMKG